MAKKTEHPRQQAPKTPEQMEADARGELAFWVDELRSERDRAKASVIAWTARVEGDMLRAFHWAEDAFDAAALHAVLSEAIEMSERGHSWEEIREEMIKGAMQSARYPSRSTSACANRAEQAKGKALAEAADSLRRIAALEQRLAKPVTA